MSIDLSDLRQTRETLVEKMDRAFNENQKALVQLKKIEELFDAPLEEERLQGPGEDYEKLLREMQNLKREGGKLH